MLGPTADSLWCDFGRRDLAVAVVAPAEKLTLIGQTASMGAADADIEPSTDVGLVRVIVIATVVVVAGTGAGADH